MFKLIALLIYMLLSHCTYCEAKETGIASWYGKENKISSTGKKLNRSLPAAAHKTLPIGCLVRVTSYRTKKSVIVLIEDRGPFHKQRIIDLNFCAARQLGMLESGTAKVTVEKI
jgi:rare lipoprotein A